MSDALQNGGYVATLQQLMADGGFAIRELPEYIKTLLDKGIWRDRIVKQTGRRAQFETFQEFVENPLVDGLGATIDQIKNLCREDVESIVLIDRELQKPPGNPTGANQYSDGILNNIQDSAAPTGTAQATGLRRLRKSRPDLLAKVVNGELSTNEAMIEAGFRQRTLTIPIDPEVAARRILKHFTQEQIVELIDLLSK